MKTLFSKALALVAIAAALFSFTTNFGGEGFEILVNGKTVLQKFGAGMDKANVLQLSKTQPTDKLTFRYHHCGKVGNNRLVTIKDGGDHVLRVWKFADVPTPVGDMSCTMKDLISLQKDGNTTFKIYYSSTELPKGRQLTSIVLANSNKVQP